MGRKCLGLLLILASPAAFAQQVATSPAPESVAVTVYRAPHRSAEEPMQLEWLNGYALITERRRVEIPAGEAEIRLEGVAGGILPESAIVTGLPNGVVEKNQDAYLLSPGSLLERSLGRRVHIRRTSKATGEVREHEAVIRSGPQGAVVLQAEDGFEALRCTGLPETIVYPSIPEGLSAKPTLSVRTRSPHAAAATISLSYLASGFDWQANYVGTLAPDEDRLDLFAWLTLANGDETSFPNASTQAVAGRVNREAANPAIQPEAQPFQLTCWPQATTSDIETVERFDGLGAPHPPPAPPPPPAMMAEQTIVVTGSRIRRAVQEELGDLKLYRIPDPVTVAANSQKQVAFLEKKKVKVELLHRSAFFASSPPDGEAPSRILVTRNRSPEGLGVPLPAGRLVLFGAGRERPILLGEGYVDDKAVGEKVEIDVGPGTGIHVRSATEETAGNVHDVTLVVSNDRATPVSYEADIEADGWKLSSAAKLVRRDGRFIWSAKVPANGTATLRYTARPQD